MDLLALLISDKISDDPSVKCHEILKIKLLRSLCSLFSEEIKEPVTGAFDRMKCDKSTFLIYL